MTSEEILEKLRKARYDLNLTWREMESLTGYHNSTIYNQLTEKYPARLDLIIDAAQVLGYELALVPKTGRAEE